MVLLYVYRNFNRVLATNRETNKSNMMQIFILACNCSEHGHCTQDTDDGLPGSGSFRFARCICENEYEGTCIIMYIL